MTRVLKVGEIKYTYALRAPKEHPRAARHHRPLALCSIMRFIFDERKRTVFSPREVWVPNVVEALTELLLLCIIGDSELGQHIGAESAQTSDSSFGGVDSHRLRKKRSCNVASSGAGFLCVSSLLHLDGSVIRRGSNFPAENDSICKDKRDENRSKKLFYSSQVF